MAFCRFGRLVNRGDSQPGCVQPSPIRSFLLFVVVVVVVVVVVFVFVFVFVWGGGGPDARFMSELGSEGVSELRADGGASGCPNQRVQEGSAEQRFSMSMSMSISWYRGTMRGFSI